MRTIRLLLTLTAAGMALAACTQGATGPPSITSVNPLTNSKLQMVVGTANVEGVGGLNVVTTMRQPSGASAVLADTPALTGPFTLPAPSTVGATADSYSTLNAGPSIEETTAGGTIFGTPQTVRPGTPVCDSATPCAGVAPNTSTFGQFGGVFGMGFAPFNSNNSGQANTYVPYSEALYDTTGDAFTPWGGPPAFDPNGDGMGTRDGEFNLGAGVLGIGEGITIFEHVTPGLGTYNLSVAIPTSPTSVGSISTSAMMTSTLLLPTATAPTILLDGAGGGTFTATLPAGATEGYVEIIDFGNGSPTCQGPLGTQSGLPVYYTIHVTASGAAVLPDTDGPNTNITGGVGGRTPSPSICTAAQNLAAGNAAGGDFFSVYLIGMDYPLFAASYPASLGNQTPTLTSNGQADITVSAPSNAQSLDRGRLRLVSKSEMHAMESRVKRIR